MTAILELKTTQKNSLYAAMRLATKMHAAVGDKTVPQNTRRSPLDYVWVWVWVCMLQAKHPQNKGPVRRGTSHSLLANCQLISSLCNQTVSPVIKQ
jgi:hypothetical protein